MRLVRRSLKALWTASSVLALIAHGVPSSLPASGNEPGRPNVLIILTDDQRDDETLAVMPQTLERFGAEGTRFTKAVATTPVCCPARASILTGRYAHNHGVLTNHSQAALDHDSTIQRYLDEAGYRTALAGKFLNKYPLTTAPPHFDRWAMTGGSYYDSKFNVDGFQTTIAGYSTDFIASWSASVLQDFESADAEPWFLYVAPYAPHAPYTPEVEYATTPIGTWDGNPAVFEIDRSDKPPYVRTAAARISDARVIRQGQLRALYSVDDLVGDVFDELDRLGEENTLAIFLSDNGFLWAEHGLLSKWQPYRPSVEIPFFVRWPGRVPAGEVSSDLVGTIDVAPTILDAAGLEPDPAFPVDGASVLDPGARPRILLENWQGPTWASLRGPGYQFVEHYGSDGAVTFREYYDLRDDPWQLTNLLADGTIANDPDIAPLSAQLAADRACSGAGGDGGCPAPESLAVPSLAVSDVFAREGDESSTDASVRVSLSAPSGNPVSVGYTTVDDSARAPADYASATGTVTIPPGDLGVSIPIGVQGDLTDENDEHVWLELRDPVGASIDDWRDGHGIVTILDDDLPELRISDATVPEGHDGSTTMTFVVSLSTSSGEAVDISYSTGDGTASAGQDYAAASGTATIPPEARTTTIPVTIFGDGLVEDDETFGVTVNGATGVVVVDGEGAGTIVDDDSPPPPPTLRIDDVQVVEGAAGTKTAAAFRVTLSSRSSTPVTVRYATADGSALAGSDYTAATGTATIAAGATSVIVRITVRGDAVREGKETFFVNLSESIGASIADPQGRALILDDD